MSALYGSDDGLRSYSTHAKPYKREGSRDESPLPEDTRLP